MAELIEKAAATIERYGMVSAGMRVGVAVSGGADSVCLLHVLRELAPRWGLRLCVLHLDHGLRGAESRADAEFVSEMAEGMGLEAVVRRAELAGVAGNLEQEGRRARLEFFAEMMARGAVERVALGHTRRDQAETVLFRFLRGSAGAGLAGIRPVTRTGLVRPLIEMGRGEIQEWLRERCIAWREDASNASLEFARNRIRHVLLPEIERDWNPRIEEALARTAEWARDEEAWWEAELARLAPEGRAVLRAKELAAMHPAVARRLVRRAIARVKGDLRGIDWEHGEAILRLARSVAGDGAVEIPGLEAKRSFGEIRLALRDERSGGYCYEIRGDWRGERSWVAGNSTIHLEVIEKPETLAGCDSVYNRVMPCVAWDRLSGSLELRNWRPGDRFQPQGATGPKKMKALFQHARIPVWDRSGWPVLADGEQVVWTRHFGVSASAAAGESSRVLLRVWESGAETSMPSKSESGSRGRASNQ